MFNLKDTLNCKLLFQFKLYSTIDITLRTTYENKLFVKKEKRIYVKEEIDLKSTLSWLDTQFMCLRKGKVRSLNHPYFSTQYKHINLNYFFHFHFTPAVNIEVFIWVERNGEVKTSTPSYLFLLPWSLFRYLVDVFNNNQIASNFSVKNNRCGITFNCFFFLRSLLFSVEIVYMFSLFTLWIF